MTLVPVALSTEPRCKFCAAPDRDAVDLVLARYYSHELKLDDALAELAELGVDRPLAHNLKRKKDEGHAGTRNAPRHTKFVDPKAAEKEREERESIRRELSDAAHALIVKVLGEDWRERGVTPSPEQILDIQRSLYVHELELTIAAGLPSGLTHDQVLKTIGEGTKRKHSEAVDELLGVGVKAIEAAIGGNIGLPPGQVVEHEPVVDAEVVEIEEGDDAGVG